MRRLNSNIQDIVPNVRLGLNLKVSLWRLKTVKSRAAGNLENRCNPIATEIKVGKTAACHTGGEEMQSQHNAIDSLGSVWRQRQRVLTWFWISWKQNNWAKQSNGTVGSSYSRGTRAFNPRAAFYRKWTLCGIRAPCEIDWQGGGKGRPLSALQRSTPNWSALKESLFILNNVLSPSLLPSRWVCCPMHSQQSCNQLSHSRELLPRLQGKPMAYSAI